MPYAFTDTQLPAQLEALPERGKITFENFPIGLCTSAFPMSGLGSYGFPMIAPENLTSKFMQIWVKNASGSMRLAMWDAVGVLNTFTDFFTPTNGLNTVPLFTPGTLVGGNLYYIGFYTSDATLSLELVGNNFDFSSVPTIPYPSIFGTGDVDSTMANYGTYNKRPWLAVSSEE
jgi:hypothetical protein